MIVHSAIAPCEECGVRCGTCEERMCNLFGPEPEPRCELHPCCEDCADVVTCLECLEHLALRAMDRAAERARAINKEAS